MQRVHLQVCAKLWPRACSAFYWASILTFASTQVCMCVIQNKRHYWDIHSILVPQLSRTSPLLLSHTRTGVYPLPRSFDTSLVWWVAVVTNQIWFVVVHFGFGRMTVLVTLSLDPDSQRVRRVLCGDYSPRLTHCRGSGGSSHRHSPIAQP